MNTYAGRMSLGMRYHSQVFTPERGKEVFDVYLDALRTSMSFSRGAAIP